MVEAEFQSGALSSFANSFSGQTPADLATTVAGLLILFYGAWTESIYRVTTANISRTEGRTFLAIARDPIKLPSPVVQLVEQLAASAEESLVLVREQERPATFSRPRVDLTSPIHPTTLGREIACTARMKTRLHRLTPALVAADTAAEPETDGSWVQKILVGIVLDARAGRRIPLTAPAHTDLGVTEDAVRGLIRAAENTIPGLHLPIAAIRLVMRSTPSAPRVAFGVGSGSWSLCDPCEKV